MQKIYTKTGDKGKTSLMGGERVSKSSLIIEVLGCIDELNASLGLIISSIDNSSIKDLLNSKQKELMNIASIIAISRTDNFNNRDFKGITIKNINKLEKEIDNWDKQLPQLINFILPSGNIPSTYAHYSRTICRRLERRIVELNNQELLKEEVLAYINRFSDWLFLFARYLNEGKDIIWKTK